MAVIWHGLMARDRIPISRLGLMVLMRILVFDGISPLWEGSQILFLIDLIDTYHRNIHY